VRVFDTRKQLEAIVPGQVLTIGNFDGVHAGHQRILSRARQTAGEKHASGVAVMTFSPHPAAILYPDRNPGVLTPLDVKTRLLEACGIDSLIVIRDSYEMLNLSPQDFVEKFLMRHVRPSAIVEGPNFNFGYGRSGNVETLAALGRERGFDVVVVEPAEVSMPSGGGVMLSSSMIRRLLGEGEVAVAAAALTRPHRLIGRTVHGRGKGREIGFPTANIEPEDQVVPAEGVYAAQVAIAPTREALMNQVQMLPAALSIGRAKTFVQDHALLIEAHVLVDDVGDLSDKWLAVDFIDRIRHQQRFASVADLVEQIKRDCERIRTILGSH
jgi:riboflavin kinase / FMN adenylyltransferase